MGTARAIPVLRQLRTKESLAAIARIRDRVGALEGHVAIVDAEDRTGALSQTDAGRLSLEED